MEPIRFKPKFDKLFYIPITIAALLLVAATVLCIVAFTLVGLLIIIGCDLFVLYFVLSSVVGYVELRECGIYIRFGFILNTEIPYDKIRKVEKSRKFYAESMVSLKNSVEHIDIRYNTYDVVSVSVADNDALIREIEMRRSK
jgi:hypothetical protein